MGTSFKPGIRGIWVVVVFAKPTWGLVYSYFKCADNCRWQRLGVLLYVMSDICVHCFKMQHFEYWCVPVVFYDPLKCLLFVIN